MTIYATPFRASDNKTTGPSTDSGFNSLEDVADAMPYGPNKKTKRILTYGADGTEDLVAFSDFIFITEEDFKNVCD